MLSIPEKPFYVYVYRDVRPGKEGQPIYVGKGTDRRAKRHLASTHNIILDRTIKKIRNAGLEPEIEIVSRFTDEAEAFVCERSLINSIGRRDLNIGPLANLTDGGEGGSGYIQTAESNRLRSEASKLIWEDPELRTRMRSSINALLQTDAYKTQKAAETKSKWADTKHAEMRRSRMKEAAARPERRAALISMLAASMAGTDLTARANKTWDARRRFVWEFQGSTYKTCAEAEAATGIKAATVYWRITHGKEGRKILLG